MTICLRAWVQDTFCFSSVFRASIRTLAQGTPLGHHTGFVVSLPHPGFPLPVLEKINKYVNWFREFFLLVSILKTFFLREKNSFFKLYIGQFPAISTVTIVSLKFYNNITNNTQPMTQRLMAWSRSTVIVML